MARWWILGFATLLAGRVSAASPAVLYVDLEVFDASGAALSLSTSSFQFKEGEEGTGQLTAGDRRIVLKARIGRTAADGCRPVNVVVRESRTLPERWRETATKATACPGEPIRIEADRDTKFLLSVR